MKVPLRCDQSRASQLAVPDLQSEWNNVEYPTDYHQSSHHQVGNPAVMATMLAQIRGYGACAMADGILLHMRLWRLGGKTYKMSEKSIAIC